MGHVPKAKFHLKVKRLFQYDLHWTILGEEYYTLLRKKIILKRTSSSNNPAFLKNNFRCEFTFIRKHFQIQVFQFIVTIIGEKMNTLLFKQHNNSV